MKQNSSKGESSRKTVYYARAGLAIGAAKRYHKISLLLPRPRGVIEQDSNSKNRMVALLGVAHGALLLKKAKEKGLPVSTNAEAIMGDLAARPSDDSTTEEDKL